MHHAFINGRRGSSPHVRGARDLHIQGEHVAGIIPACAGSTHWQYRGRASAGDHPRMCGEHFRVKVRVSKRPGSSPHVRGALRRSGGQISQ